MDKKLLSRVKIELNREPSILTTRERMILSYRFGLFDRVIHTLEDTGKAFKITRERVRQIENKIKHENPKNKTKTT